jgi:hypothetical protein
MTNLIPLTLPTTPVYVQYSNSPVIRSVIDGLKPYFSVSTTNFYTDYFNLYTANTDGLDNWGRILNLSRYLNIQTLDNIFGFDEIPLPPHQDTGEYQNFYSGSTGDKWISGGSFYSASNNSYQPMPDDIYRAMLLMRYSVLTTNATLYAINIIMNNFIKQVYPDHPERRCTVKTTVIQPPDPLATAPMQITYEFNYNLEIWESFLYSNTSNQIYFLPTPIGVEQVIKEIITP